MFARIERFSLPHDLVAVETEQTLAAFAILVGVGALVAIARRRAIAGFAVSFQLRPTHLVPAVVQLLILAYWGAHWGGVGRQLAWIPAQIAFAYGCDALLALAGADRWIVGLLPLPIVLSMNLFIWFDGGWFFFSYLLVAIAVASRALLLRADGRHPCNPSALAIGLFGAAFFALPDTYVDISNQYSFAPNMWETLLLLSLVPLARFGLLPMSLAAVVGLGLAAWISPRGPNPWQPAFFLALTLFAGDPATAPRTPPGRVLSGLALGLLVGATSRLLVACHQHDFFSKVWPVLVVNALAPRFDRWGARLPARLASLLGPRFRLAHAALWLVYLVRPGEIAQAKTSHTFHAGLVEGYELPLIVREPDGAVLPEHNPIYCRSFSYLLEGRAWRARR